MIRPLVAAAWAALAVLPLRAAAAGLRVESVEPGYAAALAGVHAGDALLAWQEDGGTRRHGTLRSPFTLAEISGDALLRGPVTLELRRGGRRLHVTVPADANGLRIEARPPFAPDVERLFARGRLLVEREQVRAGTRLWWQAARLMERRGGDPAGARCSILRRIAAAWAHGVAPDEARRAFAEAQECVEPIDLGWMAGLLEMQGLQEMNEGHMDVAEDALQAALDLLPPNSLARLGSERALVTLDTRRGRLDDALRRAAALLERCRRDLPGSLFEAEIQCSVSYVSQLLNDAAASEAASSAALSITERAGSDTQTWARALSLRGGMLSNRGIAEGERYFRRAYEWHQRRAPGSAGVVLALVNLSGMVGSRGDTAAARLCLDRAVRLAAIPAIARRLSPMTRVILLADLGDVNADQGQPRAAMALFHRALRAAEAELPGHDLLPDLRMSLARVHLRVGDRRLARDLLYSSLDHCDTYGCGAWTQGSTLLELGGLALAEGEVDVAEDAYTQALALIQPTRPLTQEHARSWAGLARVARRRGRPDEAERDLRMAVDTIEAARQTAARTDEARALFASGLYGIYQELVDLLAGQGRTAEAFAALERSHARSLLALLAERRLDEDFDLPPPLAAERKRIASAYDHTRGRLQEATTPAARQEAEARLDELRDQHEALAVRIRQQAPSQASFRYPQPLDAPAIALRLDPGTLLLAYSVGEQKTLAFALSVPPDGGTFALRSFTIPAGDAMLRPRIAAWRRNLEQYRPIAGREAQAFYDLLLRPVAPEIARAGRLVLVPDGPLHGLPFAALRDGARFLADVVPLSVAASGTLAALTAAERRPVAWEPPVVFADAALVPLPGSRAEAAAIAHLFPSARSFVGPEAREEQAKALSRHARFVHFGVHGEIDDLSPLDSGLVLARGRGTGESAQNGLLQAWEIMERLRLDTDLVTLAACRSAAGPERAGEGTMGLVRAFQYAGARSVLASLWDVGDRSTASFMRRFYEGLARGATKSEALQRAQRAAIREGLHPARWAAFQLYGDWK